VVGGDDATTPSASASLAPACGTLPLRIMRAALVSLALNTSVAIGATHSKNTRSIICRSTVSGSGNTCLTTSAYLTNAKIASTLKITPTQPTKQTNKQTNKRRRNLMTTSFDDELVTLFDVVVVEQRRIVTSGALEPDGIGVEQEIEVGDKVLNAAARAIPRVEQRGDAMRLLAIVVAHRLVKLLQQRHLHMLPRHHRA
jgi:hypothetical protein